MRPAEIAEGARLVDACARVARGCRALTTPPASPAELATWLSGADRTLAEARATLAACRAEGLADDALADLEAQTAAIGRHLDALWRRLPAVAGAVG